MRFCLIPALTLLLVGCGQGGPSSSTSYGTPKMGRAITGSAVKLEYGEPKLAKSGDNYVLVVPVSNPGSDNTDGLSLKEASVGGTKCVGVIADEGVTTPMRLPLEFSAGFLQPSQKRELRFPLPADFKPGKDLEVVISMEYTTSKESAGYEGKVTSS